MARSKRNTNMTTTIDVSYLDRLHELAERTRALAADTAKLEAQFKGARGTQELKRAREHDTAATELYGKLLELVSARPMRFRELVDATKAEENKIKTCIVRMQREDIGLVNLGNQYQALWFIPDSKLLARLQKG